MIHRLQVRHDPAAGELRASNKERNMSDVSENRRTEYMSLREEIYRSDRTCVMLMGFLLTVTSALATASFSTKLSQSASHFALWLLPIIWFLGFWYFTEKRFVIIRVAAYIRERIEIYEEGLGWEQFSRELSEQGNYRRALPLDPYHLEVISCALVIFVVPIIGVVFQKWEFHDWLFLSACIVPLVFIFLAVRALIEYGKPQQYVLNKSENA